MMILFSSQLTFENFFSVDSIPFERVTLAVVETGDEPMTKDSTFALQSNLT